MTRKFEGIYPPVTTPFTEDGRLRLDALERNIVRYLKAGMSGLLLLGSNGESVHLTGAEKLEMVRRVSPLVPEERQLVVGVGFSTTSAALRFIAQIADFHVTAILVSVPSYYRNRMTREALVVYFQELAERSPFPLLLYNVPQYSGIEIAPDLVAELAAHPNIVGMKDSSANVTYLQSVLEGTAGHQFEVLMGSAQAFGPALALGIRAAILAVACAFPELPLRVLNCCLHGESTAGAQLVLCRAGVALTTRFGVPGLKYAMDLAGWEGGCCRKPLLPLTGAECEELRRMLDPVEEMLGEAFRAPALDQEVRFG